MKIFTMAVILTMIVGCLGIFLETITLSTAMLILIAINSTALAGKFILDWDKFDD